VSAAVRTARALAAPRGAARLVPARARGVLLRAVIGRLLRREGLGELLDRLASGASPAAVPQRGAGRTHDPRETVAGLRRLPATCLHRALAGYAALRASGAEPRFVIGVAREGDEVLAHAWIEQGGAPVEEPADPRRRFTVAFVHPPEPHPARAQEEAPMSPSRPSPEVLLTRLSDGTGVLLHLGTKFYYTLNRTGVVVWEAISKANGGADREAIVEALVVAFSGVERGEAEADVDALLGELEAEGLLAKEA
jgi:hypothetical protein